MWLLQVPHHEFVAVCSRITLANADTMIIDVTQKKIGFPLSLYFLFLIFQRHSLAVVL